VSGRCSERSALAFGGDATTIATTRAATGGECLPRYAAIAIRWHEPNHREQHVSLFKRGAHVFEQRLRESLEKRYDTLKSFDSIARTSSLVRMLAMTETNVPIVWALDNFSDLPHTRPQCHVFTRRFRPAP
jgi:hypothetical protein